MFRQIITPKNTELMLQLPAEFVGKEVEVIAFTTDDVTRQSSVVKKTYQQAIEFFKKHSVDFSKIAKWKREDLYE